MLTQIDHNMFRAAINSGYAKLENHKQAVNNLNVFPVPDGDTGTNMALTLQYAVKEMEDSSASSISEVTFACSNGALMGARGNSGVILSQLFRGFSKACQGKNLLTISDLVQALKLASDMAYNAVMKPTEGTILTVAREMSEYAEANHENYNDGLSFFSDIIKAGSESLDRTPELLQVLKDAGVVDAGGKGLLLILEGALESLQGEPVTLLNSPETEEEAGFTMDVNSDILYAYCTEFLILSNDSTDHEKYLIDKFLKLGDSLVVVQDENLIKIHVHTNEPWTAMKIAADFGELTKIKIDNMKQQHSELFEKAQTEQSKYSQEHTDYIIISVSSGEGLSTILKDLGVTYIIEGGQTMNPSTQDFIDIINNTNADNYILLPNNKNIILAAEQAAKISDKNIAVLATKTIPEAISALMNFNSSETIENNIDHMGSALSEVTTGQITYAVRDSSVQDMKIKKDSIIGIMSGNIITCEKTVESAAIDLITKMIKEDTELLTIYYGQDTTEDQATKLQNEIQTRNPQIDVELFEGGQPLYYYIISAE